MCCTATYPPAPFSEEQLAFTRTVFVPRTLKAGECLQRGGETARHAGFVAYGCLRSYVVEARGKEHVVQFAPEQWWLADAINLNTGTRAESGRTTWVIRRDATAARARRIADSSGATPSRGCTISLIGSVGKCNQQTSLESAVIARMWQLNG
jgi:CRP-like cAMP-binding protein